MIGSAGLGDVVAKLARTLPDHVAVVDAENGIELSAPQLDRRRRQLANALLARGLAPGERVAVVLANGVVAAESIYGIASAGLVQVNVNQRLTAAEIGYILTDAGASAAIVDRDSVGKVEAAAPGITPIVVDGAGGPYAAMLDAASVEEPGVAVDAGAPAVLIYTSGTTGRPKGVVLSHANVVAGATNYLMDSFGPDGGTYLACIPYFHVACVPNLAAVMRGMTVVVCNFEAAKVARLIEQHRITHVPMPPTVIAMLLDGMDGRTFDLSSLRRVLYAGSPMPEQLLRRGVERIGPVFEQAYGMTETAGFVTVLRPHEHDLSSPQRLATCGREITRVEVDIVDSEGHPVPNGVAGEIVARGPSVTGAYWNDPVATERAFFGSWFRTGDVGRRDDDGFVTIVGRLKDVVITGGQNVYAAEVEAVLGRHPDVREVAVIGVADDVWGETVAAVVVGADTVDVAALRAWCASRLAPFKHPRVVFHVDALPRTAIGKVNKPELRARLGMPP